MGLKNIIVTILSVFLVAGTVVYAGTEPLTFQDLMRFRQIEDQVISGDGHWIAYALKPDRGDGEAVVRAVDKDTEYRVDLGGHPAITADGGWLACTILPTQQAREEAADNKADDEGPHSGLSLLSLADGAESRFEDVESFAFSDDGNWIAWKRYKPLEDEEDEDEEVKAAETDEGETPEEDEDRPVGTTLVLRNLTSGNDLEIAHVVSYVIDEPSRYLAYDVASPDGSTNGIYVRSLGDGELTERKLHGAMAGRYSHLLWAEESSRLAFVAAVDDDQFEPGPADVWTWDGGAAAKPRQLAASADAPEGWRIPSENTLSWSRDGDRLFFGYAWIDPVVEKRRLEKKEDARQEKERQRAEDAGEPVEDEPPFDAFDVEGLLKDRGVDVWHWNDPYIIPHQKKQWDEVEKHRTYIAVGHIESGKVVRLADRDLPHATPADSTRAVLATSDLPHRKLVTWDGEYNDVYHVDLNSGERQLVVRKLRESTPQLSPDGRFVVFWNDPHWYMFDADDGTTRNLTETMGVPFADEDDDYPAPDSGYGIAGWVAGDRSVLIYDKFDVWRFPSDGGAAVNLTAGKGREAQRQFRLVDLDPDVDYLQPRERLLLHGYHDRLKNDSFWQTRVDRPALKLLLEEDRLFRFIAKAEDEDRLLYTRQSYEEFPDLWVADLKLNGARKLSTANPQMDRFARGSAELVEWASADGQPLQGVLIKPGNYEPGKRYPVLVYFYRFFSQRLHGFNEPVINHRPSFPMYASNGYAVFLPDIRFEIGRPGMSAVKALVPGVQKLVDMGIADPDAIGLHGHSWSGYQAAYVITQTNIFAATVAGAPVSNMTSAYSGIRLKSGLARQFQYEQSQSRIGDSMDAALQQYIENSPVFYVRHIQTPLLIQFGDRDEAVPWQQGIELYLAMRRLGKDIVFLQYRDEPHHLKKYPNKLDYSIKMMEYFDHHLKGAEAPAWMTEGVPYRGE
jgi:hypothetical protein